MSETINHRCPSCGASIQIVASVAVSDWPKYVRINATTMRRVDSGYWRDNGAWGCDAEWVDGKLVATSNSIKDINGIELIPITREEWARENGESVR